MSMNYRAGNTIAVKGELDGIQTKEALFDAGEIIAVKAKIQADSAEAGMSYSCGLTSALLAAMGNNSGTEVSSKSYANISSDKKLYGTVKREAGTYEITSLDGVVSEVELVADGNNLKINPGTFYYDGDSSPLTLITSDFDIFIDDNSYLKMYNNSKEFFLYKDASKSSASKIKVSSIKKIDTSTKLTQLLTTDSTTVMTIKFRVWNMAKNDYLDISLAPKAGNLNTQMSLTCVAKNGTNILLWNSSISRTNNLHTMIVKNNNITYSWNWLAINGQLNLRYNNTNYPYWQDKANTIKAECSYIEVLS